MSCRKLDNEPNKDIRYLLFNIPNFRTKLEQLERNNNSKEEIVTEIKRELSRWLNILNTDVAVDIKGIRASIFDYRKQMYKSSYGLDKVGILDLTKDRLNYWQGLAQMVLKEREEGC
ncbi:MAG: hypothetical protein Q3988_05610 [Gemella sp.]|nr:hypothetical protein [Gemella sp.]